MIAWTVMEQTARGLTGQEYDYSFYTKTDPALAQVVTQENVPSDPQAGYIAFPDYRERFAELWAGE